MWYNILVIIHVRKGSYIMSKKLESIIEKAKEGNIDLTNLNYCYEVDTLKEMIKKERKDYINLSNPFLEINQKEMIDRKIKNLDNLTKSIDELQQEVMTKKEKQLKEKHPVAFGLFETLAVVIGAVGIGSDISEKISDSIPVNYPSDEEEDKAED